MEEVGKAYEILIKRSHPDRVHDMSPVFRDVAESETKKVNATYRQALSSTECIEGALCSSRLRRNWLMRCLVNVPL